jgi:hypothetical protein
MDSTKLEFLKAAFLPALKALKADDRGRWGRMNGQQMVEHYTQSVRIASGRLHFDLVNSGEVLARSRAFLQSDKPFRENTKNPILPDDPQSTHHPDMASSLKALQDELGYFFDQFENKPDLKTLNPLFGELDYQMNVQFLYKHAIHHLRQFGLLDSL